MTDQPYDSIDDELDDMDISEQLSLLVRSVKEASLALLVAHQAATRIKAALGAGVLTKKQALRFANAVDDIIDLQGTLFLNWTGLSTPRETLELLHLLYYRREECNNSLDDDLLDIRRRRPRKETDTARTDERRYWKLLRKYADEHPDEPTGWQDTIERERQAKRR